VTLGTDLARGTDNLPPRSAPRLYTRKGVRYRAWAENGVIWVVEIVEGATATSGGAEGDERRG
jgi:hypothetical protein